MVKALYQGLDNNTSNLGLLYEPIVNLHILNLAHLRKYYKITESK